MSNEPQSKKMEIVIVFEVINGEEVAHIEPKIGPKVKHLKYGMKNDPKNYTFNEFSDIVSEIYLRRGQPLNFFVINEETGRREPGHIDISPYWPHELFGGSRIEEVKFPDLSEILKKIGL